MLCSRSCFLSLPRPSVLSAAPAKLASNLNRSEGSIQLPEAPRGHQAGFRGPEKPTPVLAPLGHVSVPPAGGPQSGLRNGMLSSPCSERRSLKLEQPQTQANMANPGQPQFPSAQEPGTASPLDLPEMEKLLTKVEGKDDKPLKLSTSLSGTLDLEQNGHGLPFKVVSEGCPEATLPWSASRASSRRASSIATASSAQDQEVPKDYLILAIASCFCPVWPLNLIPLIFSIMVSVALRSRAQWAPDLLPGACRTESWGRGLGGRLPFSPGLLPLLLEKGPRPGDLLFAVLPPLCSSAPQQRLCTYPPGEGPPGITLS